MRIDSPDGPTTIDYDAAGRRTRESGPTGETTYVWDALDRLVAIDRTSRSARLDVDALGSLIGVDGARLVWDPAGSLPQLLAIDGDEFVGLPGLPIATTGQAGTRWLDADWRGSLGATDPPPPTPWGASGGDTGLGPGFRGELGVAGLVWLGHRPYDPSTRAFLAPDPLPGIAGQAVAANPYHYAANDPLGLLDPLGLRPLSMAAYQQLREQRQTGLVDRAGQLAGTVGEGIATGLRYVAGGALVATGFVGSLPIIGAPVHPATGTVQAVATMANGDFDPNHIVRNFVNGPTTTAGLGLALIGDARIRYDGQTGMWVATEATTGFGRAGTTYGSTFVTGELDPDENLKHHESIHAEQYARFGGGIIFPILYFWEEHNHPGCENKYEREAGLEDGRYSGPGCN